MKLFHIHLAYFGLLALLLSPAFSQTDSLNSTLAHQHFEEARAISEADAGKLWGVELYGPMIFADPKTRMVIANQADDLGYLKRDGNVFSGRFPDDENISNTATDWAGKRWTMVMWPLPENRERRAQLMLHELFHRIQHLVGAPMANPANAHLDEMDGRIYLQLEWQALEAALQHSGSQRQADVKNGLVFRYYRQMLYPEGAPEEIALETNEGLSEYTGVKLSGRNWPETLAYLSDKIDQSQQMKTLVRSFAYTSGPLYGLLLDDANSNWRQNIKDQNDFGKLLKTAYQVELPIDLKFAADEYQSMYNGDEIRVFEEKREAERQEKIAGLMQKFARDPIVIIPLQMMNISFDPTNIQPLDSLGTYYPNMRITDTWGILTVENGAVVGPRWARVRLSATGLSAEVSGSAIVEGDGWKLELTDDWRVEKVETEENYRLRRTP